MVHIIVSVRPSGASVEGNLTPVAIQDGSDATAPTGITVDDTQLHLAAAGGHTGGLVCKVGLHSK